MAVTATSPEESTRPEPGEVTKSQAGGMLLAAAGLGYVHIGQPPIGTYANYRKMMADPTIALAEMTVRGPILAGSWSFETREGVPEERKKFIQDQLEPMRQMVVDDALKGGMRLGWQGWEKVFAIAGGKVTLKRLKPLLQDITTLLIDAETGKFSGFKQSSAELPVEKCLLYTHDREGDNYYGRPRLENLRSVQCWWTQCNDGAARYDKKVAGAFIVISYPPGRGIGADGVERSNGELAVILADSILAGKPIVVPKIVGTASKDTDANDPKAQAWSVEILEDKGGRQPSFLERLRYLDSQKFRGWLRPERSGLAADKGGIGTSDTGDMMDLALTDGELLHADICRTLNWHVVDQLLVLNFGEEARGSVYITPAPLRDSKGLLLQILIAIMANPSGLEMVGRLINLEAVIDQLGLPKAENGDGLDIPAQPTPGVDTTGPLADQARKLFASVDPTQAAAAPVLQPGQVETSQSTVLNGAQVTAATAIVEAVAQGNIPRDAGIGQLEILFNLTTEQAERIMGTAGTSTPTTPNPNPAKDAAQQAAADAAAKPDPATKPTDGAKP